LEARGKGKTNCPTRALWWHLGIVALDDPAITGDITTSVTVGDPGAVSGGTTIKIRDGGKNLTLLVVRRTDCRRPAIKLVIWIEDVAGRISSNKKIKMRQSLAWGTVNPVFVRAPNLRTKRVVHVARTARRALVKVKQSVKMPSI
jgi:hypothetical protein